MKESHGKGPTSWSTRPRAKVFSVLRVRSAASAAEKTTPFIASYRTTLTRGFPSPCRWDGPSRRGVMGAARRLRSGRQADTVHGVKAVPKSIIDRIFPSRSNEHASYGGPADGHGYSRAAVRVQPVILCCVGQLL
jgi:hypothetical protein